ncbi:MAG: glycosyltransferase family 2 protein [Microthrixaceae bacterium]
MQPRFSVVVPVRDRAESVGRVVTGVLTQTFSDTEIVVVDDGSSDATVAAARAAGDERVRVIQHDGTGVALATAAGLDVARGRWAAVLDADTEVSAVWLARMGRLVDSTGARFATCGGEQRHVDGSTTEISPRAGSSDPLAGACLRSGAFVTETRLLRTAAARFREVPPHADANPTAVIGGEALRSVLDADDVVARTPERLVRWSDQLVAPPIDGDELRLDWAFQALDVLARSPIPDADLLARYATIGGVAAARLRRRSESRMLFRVACLSQPEVRKHWGRLVVSYLAPISDRVWNPLDDELVDSQEPADATVDEPTVDLTEPADTETYR